jgi:hypothetical protein
MLRHQGRLTSTRIEDVRRARHSANQLTLNVEQRPEEPTEVGTGFVCGVKRGRAGCGRRSGVRQRGLGSLFRHDCFWKSIHEASRSDDANSAASDRDADRSDKQGIKGC